MAFRKWHHVEKAIKIHQECVGREGILLAHTAAHQLNLIEAASA